MEADMNAHTAKPTAPEALFAAMSVLMTAAAKGASAWTLFRAPRLLQLADGLPSCAWLIFMRRRWSWEICS